MVEGDDFVQGPTFYDECTYTVNFLPLSLTLSLEPNMQWSDVKWKSLSHVQLFATPWTIQSMEFSRPEHWSG